MLVRLREARWAGVCPPPHFLIFSSPQNKAKDRVKIVVCFSYLHGAADDCVLLQVCGLEQLEGRRS